MINKKTSALLLGTLSVALAAHQTPALAQSQGNAGNTNAEQQSGSTAGNMQQQSNNDVTRQAAKASLGSQSLLIQTSLQSALDQLQGLKTQLSEIPANHGETMNQVKYYKGNIQRDMKTADHAQNQLDSHIENYPQLASSNDAKLMSSSLSELQTFNKTWSSRASNDKYWLNRAQALQDINVLQKQLSAALASARNFSSNQLNIG